MMMMKEEDSETWTKEEGGTKEGKKDGRRITE